MKVTREKVENCQAFLTIEMEPEEVEESLDKAYRRLVKKTNVPGFRKGKATREILERYLGRENLFEDALNHLIPEAYEQALKEQEIEAFARPAIEIAQNDPVVFKATVPLAPRTELGDYRHIQVKPEPIEVAEADVNAAMEQLRHQHAIWEPVERPVAFNDVVVLDIESDVEGKPLINRKGLQYQVLENLPFPCPGFAEQLPGMTRDEVKEFSLQLPPDYPRKDLAGKEASFKVKVSEIKQEVLPELNDEFAAEIGTEYKSLDLLRERVSADLRQRAEEKASIDFEDRVIEAVVGLAQVEYPPIIVEMEIDHLLNQQAQHWQMDGKGLEEYLGSIGKTTEELRAELRPLATKRVTQSLVLGKVVDEEKIEVADAEVDIEIENVVKGVDDRKKEELRKSLGSSQGRKSIERLLINRKTAQRLVEIARASGE